MLSRIFSTRPREGRFGYAVTVCGFPVAMTVFVLIFFLPWLSKTQPTNSLMIAVPFFFLFLVCITFYVIVAGNIRRLHDLDKSGAYFFLMLIPIINIGFLLFLAFKKGTDGANRFGDEPATIPGEIFLVPIIFVGAYFVQNYILEKNDDKLRQEFMKEKFGQFHMTDEKIENKIAESDRRIQTNSKDAFAYAERGYANYQKGRLKDALDDFTSAIEISPDYEYAYMLRGDIYDDMGQLEKALLDFNEAIRLNPNNSRTWVNRGIIYSKKGNQKEAIANFDQAIILDPKSATAFYNRGYSYTLSDQPEEAVVDYTKAIEINSQRFDAYNNRAAEYVRMGEYDKAQDDVDVLRSNGIFVPPDILKGLKERKPVQHISVQPQNEASLTKKESVLEEVEPFDKEIVVEEEKNQPEKEVLTGEKTIVLKSGRNITGKVLEQGDDFIKIEFKGVGLTFYNNEIESVQ